MSIHASTLEARGLTVPALRPCLGKAPNITRIIKVRDALMKFAADASDIDEVIGEIAGRERWIVNVRINETPAPPELHQDWHDLSLYLTGGNDVRVGGTYRGAEEVSNGEWRKGMLSGSQVFPVRPGDLLWTPAGIPHQSHFLPRTAFIIVKIRIGTEGDPGLLAHVPNLQEPAHMREFAVVPVTTSP